MKLRFTSRAIRDIAEIADYIRTRNPAAAARVRDSILDSLRTLMLFPNSGRAQALEGVRKLVTRRYRYLVYYVVDTSADEMVILTIQHPARDRDLPTAS
jgi:plasmid stabilization system protein ParE